MGWCVDANGDQPGKGPYQGGMTEHDCYEQCQQGSRFKGCAYNAAGSRCITYSGNVLIGNGHSAYTCYLTPR